MGLVAGGSLPSGAIGGDASRLLVTFLGLVAASVLPTVTLMVNSISSSGRSVHAVEKLGQEAQRAIRALFVVLGLTGAAVLALILLNTPTPWSLPGVLGIVEYRMRFGQAVALALLFATLNRTRIIPGTIFRCLELKVAIVAEEARQRTGDNAPKPGQMAATFANKPGFGAIKPLEELRRG